MPRMSAEPQLETVNLRLTGGELRLELNRPDTLNAWIPPLGRDILAALEYARSDEVRAVTITGAGRAFSSGADLRAGFETTEQGHPDVATPLREVYHPVIAEIRRLPKPVLAAVNGPAVGIGCSLALACDLIVARESSYLLLAFINIGLVPDGGSSLLVPARAGFTRAAEMAMLGERIPAPQALEWGLINRVISDGAFDAEVDALGARLAAGPTRAYAAVKYQLNSWLFERMEEQLDLEKGVQQEMAESGDFLEGVTAFLQKRPAKFGGH
jgi:2-(1,2-epoxy-1,2-dihydrophenyl)acetyl-CoA isomerase